MQPTPPSEIIPGLWIGDRHTAANIDFMRNNDIGAVLNCTMEVRNYFPYYDIEYMRLPLDDMLQPSDVVKMDTFLPYGVMFIHKNRDLCGKNVFVHCAAGVERSCTNVVAYLCKMKNMSLRSALNYVINKRPIAFFEGHDNHFESSLIKFCG